MERGGVRARHDEHNLTAIFVSNSHVGVEHPSLPKRAQNRVPTKNLKQDSVDAHQRCSGAADWSTRKGTVVPRKETIGVVATTGARGPVGRNRKLVQMRTSRRHDTDRVLKERQVLKNAAGPPSVLGCTRQSWRLPWMSVSQS